MHSERVITRQWKGALAGAFSLFNHHINTQIHLWYVRGADWGGSCAYSDWDELAYVAYAKRPNGQQTAAQRSLFRGR
jgi:hypothetical protein